MLVENYVPGKLESMGLGYEDVRKANPALVYASISGAFDGVSKYCYKMTDSDVWNMTVALGYGQTGPYAKAPGYDVVIEAEAGLMHMYAICPLPLPLPLPVPPSTFYPILIPIPSLAHRLLCIPLSLLLECNPTEQAKKQAHPTK